LIKGNKNDVEVNLFKSKKGGGELDLGHWVGKTAQSVCKPTAKDVVLCLTRKRVKARRGVWGEEKPTGALFSQT